MFGATKLPPSQDALGLPQGTEEEAHSTHQQDQDGNQFKGRHVTQLKMSLGNDSDRQHRQGTDRQDPAKEVVAIIEDDADTEEKWNQYISTGDAKSPEVEQPIAKTKSGAHGDIVEEKVTSNNHHNETQKEPPNPAFRTASTTHVLLLLILKALAAFHDC